MANHKIPLSDNEKQFIRKNRLTMSMANMGKQIGVSYNRVRNFMIQENLMLTKSQVDNIRFPNRKKSKQTQNTEPQRTNNNRWYYDAYAAN